MPVLKNKFCVLFTPLISTLLACNNSGDSASNENLNTDTMNMTASGKEPQLEKAITGSAGRLFVSDGGAGGVPVLFLHSFGGSTRHWENQLEHLRINRRAVAFDLRGHGQSEAPDNHDYRVESLSNDIAAVVDSLGLEKFVLVGHSMGGFAAIEYAGNYPDKVAGLLVTGTPGKTPPEQSMPVITSLESEKYAMVMDSYMKKLLAGSTLTTNKLEREGINKIPKEASISIIKAVFKYDPLPSLRDYPGPKLIVSRSEEEEQPNSLHRFFPGIPYKTIEETSHWIQLDKPNEFNRVLDEFLATVDKKNL